MWQGALRLRSLALHEVTFLCMFYVRFAVMWLRRLVVFAVLCLFAFRSAKAKGLLLRDRV